MKKLLAAFSAIAAPGLTATQAVEILTVAAIPMPHTEILNVVRPLLAEGGVGLKVKELTDYVQPNVQVSEKYLDANFFQHQPHLDEFNKTKGINLAAVIGIHIEPLNAYSSEYKGLDELPSGATVVIPNNATSDDRALLLLDKAGMIRLKDNKSIIVTPKDIVDNPKNVKIHELEIATLSCVLTQVDMTLINANRTLEARLNPTKGMLVIKGSDSPYVNIFVARPNNGDSDAMQKLVKALHSAEVKQFIQERYKGVVVPAS